MNSPDADGRLTIDAVLPAFGTHAALQGPVIDVSEPGQVPQALSTSGERSLADILARMPFSDVFLLPPRAQALPDGGLPEAWISD